jgi:hypothetical protein
VDGTYVAVAKNPQGVTRVTFMIQEEGAGGRVVSAPSTTVTPAPVPVKRPNTLDKPNIKETFTTETEKSHESTSPSPMSRPASVSRKSKTKRKLI